MYKIYLAAQVMEGIRDAEEGNVVISTDELLKTYGLEVRDQIQQQKKGEKVTLLIFHHDDWREYTPMFAECSYTWAQFLKSLKLFCETGKGRPWPNQHSDACVGKS